MTYQEQGRILVRAFEGGAFDELALAWWKNISDRRATIRAAEDFAASLLDEPVTIYAWDLVLDAAPRARSGVPRIPLGLFYHLREGRP